MGDELLGLLGVSDLNTFNQTVQASDPYGLASRSIMSWQPDYSVMSPWESGLSAFGKSFMAGMLGNVARQNAADQLASVVKVLPSLRSDPYSVATPEGVDSSAFNILRGTAIIKNEQNQEVINRENRAKEGDLLKSILPHLVNENKLTTKDALDIAISDDPRSLLERVTSKAVPQVELGEAADSPLASGKDSTQKKLQAYFQSNRLAGMPATQAASAAKEQLKGEISSNNKSFDDAKELRTYGQNLLQVANTARAGLQEAGQTGSGVASWYEKLVSTLAPVLPGSQEEAKRQAAGDTLLDSIAPDIIKMARPVGGGATSDFEARAYLGSGPSSSNTPEANAILIQRLENLGKLNIEKADFLEAYRDANSGSTIGAEKKWSDYLQKFPTFVNGEINTSRPSWQEYFMRVGNGDYGAPTEQSVATADLNAFIAEARAAGLTKEQARAKWLSLGGQ